MTNTDEGIVITFGPRVLAEVYIIHLDKVGDTEPTFILLASNWGKTFRISIGVLCC